MFLLVIIFCYLPPISAYAQEQSLVEQETLKAYVKEIKAEEERTDEFSPEPVLYQKLELLVTSGSLQGEEIIVENGLVGSANPQVYKVGDKVLVNYSTAPAGEGFFSIVDYQRTNPMLWLFGIFVVVVTLVARARGLASLAGLLASFLVLFLFIVPKIAGGSSPILVALLGSLVIIPVTFYISHGFNKKTTVAIVATFISLIITGVLSLYFVEGARLSGFSSDEAGFIQATRPGEIDMKGLLLAGIIIGVLGILDDVTVSQASIVRQLKQANPKMNLKELYFRAMDVGHDHISSMVNTLILVYTGASLPLLILFVDNPQPFMTVINHELIAEEIIRTLVGSIGLVLAVPITTLLAARVFQKQ